MIINVTPKTPRGLSSEERILVSVIDIASRALRLEITNDSAYKEILSALGNERPALLEEASYEVGVSMDWTYAS